MFCSGLLPRPDAPGSTRPEVELRFELDEKMRRALKQGAGLAVGVDHPNYRSRVTVAPEVRQSLAGDLA